MKIAGFIKQSFIDYPGKIASVIFTAGCNLHCPFCHNHQLIRPDDDIKSISEETVLDYLRQNASLLDGLVITGGEPFMQRDLFEFIQKVKMIPLQIKIDTNGTFPDALNTSIDNGFVDYIAMDIKHCFILEKYREASGNITKDQFEQVKQSISILKHSSVEHEFRTTIIKGIHELQDLKAIAEILKGTKKWALQNFRNENVKSGKAMQSFTKGEIQDFLDALDPMECGVCVQ